MQANQTSEVSRDVDYDWMNPLLTDIYQIKMTYAEWKAGRADDPSVFEMFFRKAPFKGKYAVFCGHDEVLKYLMTYKFTQDHIDYLKTIIPNSDPKFFEWLMALDCSQITVHGAAPEEIVFPGEPLLRLEGPFALLQMIETPILNLTNFQTLIATNASRLKMLAGKSTCVEFGLRRAQGPNGAMTASKYSFLGGFDGTSNVYAGYLNGMPLSGTQAHSFIMSFEKEEDIEHSRTLEGVDLLEKALKVRADLGWTETNLGELYAFITFAVTYPKTFSALVDSYSTLKSGVKNFTIIALVLKQEFGYDALGIRLDSGDLAQLSKDCKSVIRETGKKYGFDFSHITIVASNDINETSLRALNEVGHEIDAFGIGTNLVTCQLQPALGMVYKVVEFQGTARMKFSEELEKLTLPGSKSVLRVWREGKPLFDIVCLTSEVGNLTSLKAGDELRYFDSRKLDTEATSLTLDQALRVEQTTKLLFSENKPQITIAPNKERRDALLRRLSDFGGQQELLESPEKYHVQMSEGCFKLYKAKYEELVVSK